MSLPAELKPASKRVDRASIHAYAEVTGDFNPIHLDPEFAARTPMKGIIAHGMLSLNMIWQALSKTLGTGAIARIDIDIRFVKPVREDDTVTGRGRLMAEGTDTYEVWVENQAGEKVINGTATLRPR